MVWNFHQSLILNELITNSYKYFDKGTKENKISIEIVATKQSTHKLIYKDNDFYLNCIAKGYDPSEDGDLVLLDKPGYIEYGPTGTSHGTPYSYDTHVPLLFYGWNIPKGETHDHKDITQIAPTLAQKLKITFPNGTESKVLLEVLDK